MRYFLIFLLLLILLPLPAFSQMGDLKGFVYNKTTGEPIEGAAVNIISLLQIRYTDANGIYAFGKIKAGNQPVAVYAPGFDTLYQQIYIEPDHSNKYIFRLLPSYTELGNFEKQGSRRRQSDSNKVIISQFEINIKKDLPRLPAIGGEPDITQFMQLIPGVISTGDQGGQLYIRGGSPVMNKVLLDGMTIYNPFHSIGLFSVFDADITKTVNVYTGGFNAQYGGRISAVMDIQTRDGDRNKNHIKISASPFASKGTIEGPIKKYKEGENSVSYLLNYKNSYLDRSSSIFYPYAAKNQGGLPFRFQDIYGKISINSPGGSKTSFFGFNFTDGVKYPGSTEYNWRSNGLGANFLFVPEGTSSIINGIVSYSDYRMEQTEPDQKPRYSNINGLNSIINFTYFFGKDELKYGFEINAFHTNFETFNSANRKIAQEDYTTELCGYIKYKTRFKKCIFEPGFRTQFYPSLGNTSLEPRFSGKYDVNSDFRIIWASGLYSQNLLSAVSDRDVVNLFYGFLSGPDNLPANFDGHPVKTRLQKSRHIISGISWDINNFNKLEVEGYIKYFNQLTNINRDKIFDDNEENGSKPDYQKKDFIVERGTAKGIDVKYTLEQKGWYAWMTYSLTFVNRFDGQRTYFPHFDRRHNANAVISYLWKRKKTSYYFNGRWSFGSGFPFTQTQGFYENLNFQKNGISTDYLRTNGSLGIQYADLNSGRLPYFHRLDISTERRQTFKNNIQLNIILSISNVYNRANIFYFDRVKYIRINQLPILPALSFNIVF